MSDPDVTQGSVALSGAQVAVLGYDAEAREHALALRAAGNAVVVGALPESAAWWRARADGFDVDRPGVVAGAAGVIVALSPGDEWRHAEARVRGGALVVFASARALQLGGCARGGMDVVFVSKLDDPRVGCRIAVHRDVTRGALRRAVGYARAAFPPTTLLRSTSVAAEAELEAVGNERASTLLALAVSAPLADVAPARVRGDDPDPADGDASEPVRDHVGPW